MILLLAILQQTAGTVSKIEISPANAEIQIGQSVRLSARALDASGKEVPGVKLNWFSGGGEGQVDSTGLVTGGYTGYVRVAGRSSVRPGCGCCRFPRRGSSSRPGPPSWRSAAGSLSPVRPTAPRMTS